MSCRILLRLTALAVLLAGSAGCEGVKRQLGLTKQPPDEFRVVSRAPLTLPPDFSLRPPAPGAPRPQEGTASDQARRAVFRAEDTKLPAAPAAQAALPADGRSPGELSLLKAAGADQIDPNIRLVVNRETDVLNADSQGFIETLVFWRKEEQPGVVVDPQAEARRLQENAALGKTVTAGETPTIERRKKALLEGIF